LQALQLMNDVQHVEAARVFAERICRQGGSTLEDRVRFAFRTVVARPPDAVELADLCAFVQQALERYRAAPEKARQLIQVGEWPPAGDIDAPELAAYTLLGNLLLNLDETIMRN
jgi:hypothetical protein